MARREVSELGTILGVWAHPDDETYSMGGIAAVAAERGQRVACVTATKGEAGSQDQERWPPAQLAEIREAELLAALDILGVKEHYWLDYPDGGCAGVDFEDAVRRLTEIFEEVQPDTVLTFGPDGITEHPDHKEVSGWTTEAFWRAGKPGSTLYYATTTPEWASKYAEVLKPYNVFADEGPPVTPRDELALDFVAPDDVLERKILALRAQASQTEAFLAEFGPESYGAMAAEETYRLGGER